MTTTDRFEELLQRRASLVTEQRRLLDKAESEDRSLNGDETQTYERMGSEISDLEGRIERLKDQRERQRSLAEAENRSAVFNPRGQEERHEDDAEKRAYAAALDSYLRKGERGLSGEEQRALVKGTDSAGGYFAPDSFRSVLVDALEQESAVRKFATVLNTGNGNELLIPRVTSHGAAQWVAEEGTKPVVDDVFEQTSLKAHKSAVIIKVSTELLEDAQFDLEGYIARELGKKIGRLEGAAFAVGAANSTTTPKGITTRSTVGKTAASATAITADEIIDLIYSVGRPYRNNARFLMSDAVVATVRKLKANNEYIWQDQFRAGEPATLLGYPVEIDPNMDASLAANDIAMVFGDIAGYMIRDVRGIRVQRLNELYAVTNHVGFLAEHRTDGDLVDTAAVRSLKMAAA